MADTVLKCNGRTHESRTAGSDLSLKRIAGLALDRLWMYLTFYSIIPFAGYSDMRYSMYLFLSVSLCALAATMAIVALGVRHGEALGSNKPLVAGGALLMSGGLVLVLATGAFIRGDSAIVAVCAAGIATGIGSAVLLLSWLEVLSTAGFSCMLSEMALGCGAALLGSLILLFFPTALANAIILICPFASAFLLQHCLREIDGIPTDGADAPRSGKTTVLFIKGLVGAFSFGALAGFYDAFAGFRTFDVDIGYGVFLLAAGTVAMLAIALISVFCKEDSLSHAYRLAMLVICFGCLLTLFMADSNTHSGGVVFAGYETFNILVAICAQQASQSFNIPPARTFGVALATLYFGEMAGVFSIYLYGDTILKLGLATITVIAMMWLLFSHLYLFTEIDLINLELGEQAAPIRPSEAPNSESEDTTSEGARTPASPTPVGNEQVCQEIVERYGLSNRETDVLELLLQGRTIARIQEALFISAGTVSTHVRHIYQKTGSANKQDLLDMVEQIRVEIEQESAGK
ncbi:transcriptional regulator MalT [Slackia heliotrinireducens]|uniref:Response regulator containing a CheY-like receiver domain and an HTH DNA-binding domain n=1 Tax=Slackia heliotrinireducens (strain ATCC 29202 / DSM 20476 / NCTC 11029 / RHS 1) TaxID=471855 RepID=C7N3L1_SLAHD|nr:helix-turn-helix transcriptional regulator [Slackia heliotrinireducens]ACV23734.1 response regulator containing a CheY-like receiver domain and an HTH DNA-binding domain [Slackia heliotrinireducens DSM 20476]VEH03335.1 transcriptional regulator MalT [Slackia heliotrinireducens]